MNAKHELLFRRPGASVSNVIRPNAAAATHEICLQKGPFPGRIAAAEEKAKRNAFLRVRIYLRVVTKVPIFTI